MGKFIEAQPWQRIKRSFSQLSFTSRSENDLTMMNVKNPKKGTDSETEDNSSLETISEPEPVFSASSTIIPIRETEFEAPLRSGLVANAVPTNLQQGNPKKSDSHKDFSFSSNLGTFRAYSNTTNTFNLKHVLFDQVSRRRRSGPSRTKATSTLADAKHSVREASVKLIRSLSLPRKRKKTTSDDIIIPERSKDRPKFAAPLAVSPRIISRTTSRTDLQPQESDGFYIRISKLAKQLNLDESAVGSLIFILDEENAID